MAIEIFNDGASLRILNKGSVILVSKLQIKTIETIRNDVVRLDIGEGALKNIYIKFADVTTPAGLADAGQLRDAINAMLLSNVAGAATEVKQDAEIGILNGILGVLTDLKVIMNTGGGGGGIKQPIRIDESTPNIIYNGFAVTGASTAEAIWAIQRVTRDKDIIVYEWADGNELYDNVWDDRYNLAYAPVVIR
ncbi:MAG TPA: hypothetical protein PKC62_08615 [Ferruginibacter sp.]|mgnify:CR=1 FL=1|jgi:hypothetical protein|nr:hypothetical protein [Chitinophagaceae bacterium]HMT76016.1 hypothetical protein [Chitinophagaceae bacterium]HMT96734.1 hypothetical protein [Ferruginibacter sp.]HMU60119.1 hypothetical protein [Chitinophagaceae bacterium]